MGYPRNFEDLVLAFRTLPGVGAKTAQRYAYEALNWSPEKRNTFLEAIEGISKIHQCERCGNLSESELCDICENHNRNQNVICVVQSYQDLMAIENMESYEGVYHVLHGAINTQKGILPDDLNIQSLLRRINKDTEEVILATNPTVEGETTALYLTKLLEGKTRVTRLASGLPMGGQLEYADSRTLRKAFEGRQNQ